MITIIFRPSRIIYYEIYIKIREELVNLINLIFLYIVIFQLILDINVSACLTNKKNIDTDTNLFICAVMWIRIRSDPHSFGSVGPDPEV